MRPLALTVLALLLIAPALLAQDAPPKGEAPAAAVDADAPVAVPEPSERAWEHYHSGIVLWVVELAWGLLVPVALLFTGFSGRMRDLAAKVGRNWFFTIVAYFVLFQILSFFLDLPLSYYGGFAREHDYGLSNQTFEKWFGDELKGLVLSTIVGSLLLWVPYYLIRKSPTRWWLYTGALAVPLMCFFMLVGPVWIAPLFNKFGPMKDQALEAKILALAARAGIEDGRVFEVEKSEDTKMMNAYVTGFMSTKRIVLWDTIIAKLDERELLVVMGHEMGHYVLGHVVTGMIFSAALLLLALYGTYRTSGFLIARFRGRFRFTELSDIASLPLLLLLVGLFLFLADPLMMAFSRYHEHEADRFGLEITHDNHAAANAFAKLQTEALAIPRPGWFVTIMRASHPPIGERIDFCNTYKPWKNGEAGVYAGRFK